jgi:hypothetical protein
MFYKIQLNSNHCRLFRRLPADELMQHQLFQHHNNHNNNHNNHQFHQQMVLILDLAFLWNKSLYSTPRVAAVFNLSH